MSCRSRRAFFARQSHDEYERIYFSILEQQFQLKEYGNLSLFEQAQMVAEDRAWWLKRLEKEYKEKAEREKQQMGSVRKPSMPSRPSISRPSMPRRH